MMVDRVLPAWLDRLRLDPALTSLLGAGWVYPATASRPVTIPSVEWLILGDVEEESFNPIDIRLDLFIRGAQMAMQVERRIRTLNHADISLMIGSVRCWSRYVDSRTLEFPSDPGVVHRTLDFQLETVRDKYQP